MLTKLPVPYGLCVGDPISHLLTVGSMHGIMGRRFPDGGLLRYRK